jgi:hypothetical protein
MSRKRILAVSEAIVYTEPLPIEDLEETTVEDYKALNDKCDKVIVKIKNRKERKSKKK